MRGKLTRTLIIAAVLMFTTSCQDGLVIGDSYCILDKPIYVSKKDKLTDGTAVEIAKHNELHDKECKE